MADVLMFDCLVDRLLLHAGSKARAVSLQLCCLPHLALLCRGCRAWRPAAQAVRPPEWGWHPHAKAFINSCGVIPAEYGIVGKQYTQLLAVRPEQLSAGHVQRTATWAQCMPYSLHHGLFKTVRDVTCFQHTQGGAPNAQQSTRYTSLATCNCFGQHPDYGNGPQQQRAGEQKHP